MTQSRTQSTFSAPIVEAQSWLRGVTFPVNRPLINLSQAAPVAPPPAPLREHLAQIILDDPSVHLYGPVLGNDDLRAELAHEISGIYVGTVAAGNVAITCGCNEAFAATIAALTGQGDEVILPTPWYFNHKMFMDMNGVTAAPLATGPDMLPDPDTAARLITPRTRAIALVSPNNPAGVEYPAEVLTAFFRLAQTHGIRLILDETYRDFLSTEGAPHGLFAVPDWDATLVHLYSFSKS
ncbi:MAG: aminotransferase class I/II-fold pyridoxal phosphate-dependent enzyme, partial [Paracoccaceae bacterium]